MVFQSYALYPHMSVFQNMAFSLDLQKMPKMEIKQRVEDAAKILQMEHLLDRRPAALSGGQRQRVETREGAQPFEKLMNAASNQRFTSGDADFPHSQLGKQARGSEEFFNGQHLGPRQKFHGLCHAVLASKITAICH